MDPSQLQPLIDFLSQHQGWLLAAIFVTAAIESLAFVGIIVPGVLMMFLLGTLAGNSALSLPLTLLMAGLGAVAGDGLSYYLGRLFHDRLHQVWPFRSYPQVLRQGEDFFRRHGGKSILIGRFIGPIRPVIPIVAGMFDMPSRQFLLFNILSAIGWALIYVMPGYLVGASIAVEVKLPPHFYWVLFGTLAILLFAFFTFFNLQWHLQSESRFHRWLRHRTRQWRWARTLWYRLSSPRSKHLDFPLPSCMLLITSLSLFVLLLISVLETRWIWELNQSTLEFFRSLRQPLLDPLFVTITLLGDVEAQYLLFTMLTLFFLQRGYYSAALHVALAGIATAVSIELLKTGLAVLRPEVVQRPPESFAFPSGHAGGSMVFWGLLGSFIAQEAPPKKRWRIYSLLSLPVLLIALSRVYLGVHWLSDILGGLLWGLVICSLTRISYSPFDREPLRMGGGGWIVLAVALTGLAIYVLWSFSQALPAYALIAGTG